MEDVLEAIYGTQLSRSFKKDVNLPVYLVDGVDFYDVTVLGVTFVLVKYSGSGRLNTLALKKHMAKYIEYFSRDIVYGFPMLTSFQRKSLIENGIPFVSDSGQLFIPFLGSYFSKCQKEISDHEVEKLSPTAQMLFLLAVYSGSDFRCSKNKAAKKLNISPMSVTRAVRDLKEIGVMEEEKIGSEIFISAIKDTDALFEMAEKYLISPVQETVYIEEQALSRLKPLKAGEYSLADRSMLGYPKYKEYAVIKSDPVLAGLSTYDPSLNTDRDLVKIQKWKYSPLLFGSNGEVDPVSLICSFIGEQDERIEMCLDEIRAEVITWQLMTN